MAAIRIVRRSFYTITQIPNDLRILLLTLAALLVPLGVIRSRKYRTISFNSAHHSLGDDPLHNDYLEFNPDESKILNPFRKLYLFRKKYLTIFNPSVGKFLIQKAGEFLSVFGGDEIGSTGTEGKVETIGKERP